MYIVLCTFETCSSRLSHRNAIYSTSEKHEKKRKEKEGLMGRGMYIYLTQCAEKQPQCGAMHNVTME